MQSVQNKQHKWIELNLIYAGRNLVIDKRFAREGSSQKNKERNIGWEMRVEKTYMQKLKNEAKSVKIKIYEELIVQSNEKHKWKSTDNKTEDYGLCTCISLHSNWSMVGDIIKN